MIIKKKYVFKNLDLENFISRNYAQIIKTQW